MKILSLIAENVKKLVAVEITPKGNLVQITGKNGQGKTSVLDAIWWALAGASHIQAAPIRKGAKSARIRLDLGEIIVTRKFERRDGEGKEYTSSIIVENAEGARFPSPQTMLDSLLGELTFDPLAFARMDPKDQFQALRRFVPGVDFEQLENEHRGDFSRRTDVKRFAKEARAAASLIVVPPETPDEPTDETAIVDELQQASEHNSQIERRKNNRAIAVEKIASHRAEAAKHKAECERLLKEIQRIRNLGVREEVAADQLQEKLDTAEPLPDEKDVAAIRARLDEARKANANVTKLQEKRKHEKLADQYDTEADDLTARIVERQRKKEEAIAKAHMPVDGLGFGEGFITLKGVPFVQASDAEQLRVSVAIAAAMNPKLRVIRVRDGSLLDDDGMQLLAQFADASDMQVWVERVDSSGKIGFVLEDGHLKNAASAGAVA